MIGAIKRSICGQGLASQVLKATLGSAGLRIAGMSFGFLVGVQLARGLGAESYGVYGLAMSLIALLTVPVEFGLPQLVTREVAIAHGEKDWSKLTGVLQWARRASFAIALLVSFIVVVAIIGLGYELSSELAMTLLAGLVLVPIVSQGKIYGAALRGLQRIVRGQISDVLLRPLLFSILLFLVPLLFVPLTSTLAMVLGAASAATALIISASLLYRNMPTELEGITPTFSARSWWASTVPMALAEGMRVLQGHLIILMLGVFSSVISVGIFRVAISISLMVAIPVTLMNVVNAPIIARLYHEQNYHQLQKLLTWTAVLMTLGSLVLISPFIFAGDFLLSSIFGSEFSQSNLPLLLLFFGVLSNSIFGCNATLLNMTGYQKRVTRASIFSLLVLIVLLPGLIYFQGVEGAAVASAVSTLLWNILMWQDGRNLLGIDAGLTSFIRNMTLRP